LRKKLEEELEEGTRGWLRLHAFTRSIVANRKSLLRLPQRHPEEPARDDPIFRSGNAIAGDRDGRSEEGRKERMSIP